MELPYWLAAAALLPSFHRSPKAEEFYTELENQI